MSDLSYMFGGFKKYSMVEADQLKEKLKGMSIITEQQIKAAKLNFIEIEELHAEREKIMIRLNEINKDITKKLDFVQWALNCTELEIAKAARETKKVVST